VIIFKFSKTSKNVNFSLDFKLKLWLYWCLTSGLVCVVIGRPHIEAWRRWFSPYLHYSVPDVHCCTQAMLYNSAAALDLVQFFDTISCNENFHKDDAIWEWSKKRVKWWHSEHDDSKCSEDFEAVDGHLIQPNLFEHIGLWSSLRKGFVDPHLILE